LPIRDPLFHKKTPLGSLQKTQATSQVILTESIVFAFCFSHYFTG